MNSLLKSSCWDDLEHFFNRPVVGRGEIRELIVGPCFVPPGISETKVENLFRQARENLKKFDECFKDFDDDGNPY